jgi:hypothetical protein
MILSKSACSKVGRSIQVFWCDPEVEKEILKNTDEYRYSLL